MTARSVRPFVAVASTLSLLLASGVANADDLPVPAPQGPPVPAVAGTPAAPVAPIAPVAALPPSVPPATLPPEVPFAWGDTTWMNGQSRRLSANRSDIHARHEEGPGAVRGIGEFPALMRDQGSLRAFTGGRHHGEGAPCSGAETGAATVRSAASIPGDGSAALAARATHWASSCRSAERRARTIRAASA